MRKTDVKFIGSTSGGTITNIAYTAGLCNGKQLDTIYHELLDAMDGEKLIAKVFAILRKNKYWKDRKDKSRNLINAFSIAYDTMLYNG